MVTKSNKKYTSALGRRKSAIATIKLFTGKEISQVNGKNLDLYFPTTHSFVGKPFTETKTTGKYYFVAKIIGGGIEGQREALTLAIARALQKIDADYTLVLRQAGLLTVDSRVRERRMVGTGGKARRQKQSPKR